MVATTPVLLRCSSSRHGLYDRLFQAAISQICTDWLRALLISPGDLRAPGADLRRGYDSTYHAVLGPDPLAILAVVTVRSRGLLLPGYRLQLTPGCARRQRQPGLPDHPGTGLKEWSLGTPLVLPEEVLIVRYDF